MRNPGISPVIDETQQTQPMLRTLYHAHFTRKAFACQGVK